MSADILRRAAEQIRDNWRASARNEFMFAVAEWLEQTADYAETEGLAVLPDGAPLDVANAYLGEDR